MAVSTTQSQPGGSDGFIASLGQGFGSFLETIGSGFGQILPVWAAQQLGLQQQDQLAQPTFAQQGQQIPSSIFLTTQTPQSVAPTGSPQNIELPINTILLIGGGLLLGFFLLVKD